MAFELEVNYFNSHVVRRLVTNNDVIDAGKFVFIQGQDVTNLVRDWIVGDTSNPSGSVTGATSTNTGVGSGATFDIVIENYKLKSVKVNAVGSGYVVGDLLDIDESGLPGTPIGDLKIKLVNPYFYTVWHGAEDNNYAINGFPNWPPDQLGAPTSNVAYQYSQWEINGVDPNWIIEESRIRGGYNNTSNDYGVKSYLVESNPEQNHRFNTIIYSGVYNSRTSYNETNVFSIGEDITRSVDPHYGGIQKLYAEDTNLTVFQENKVSRALIDKDAIFSAEGGGTVTSSKAVIGQITPYSGEYGISKNPESFDFFGFRKYFADKYRKSILRLSRDGITEISQYGMSDYFRDELSEISDEYKLHCVDFSGRSVTQVPSWPYSVNQGVNVGEPYVEITNPGSNINLIEIGMQMFISPAGASSIPGPYVKSVDTVNNRIQLTDLPPQIAFTGDPNDKLSFCSYKRDEIIGVYDNYKDNYILSLVKPSESSENETEYSTITFDESVLGWVSFYSYFPDQSRSIRNNLYSTKGKNLYLHYVDSSQVPRNSFYGADSVDSSIDFVFNENVGIAKNFKTFGYEGSNGWEVTEFKSGEQGPYNGQLYQDQTNPIKSYDEGSYRDGGIQYRAGFYRKQDKYYANLVNKNPISPGEVIFNESGGGRTTGIKGFFATVKIKTDSTTEFGGAKELFSVATEFVPTSQ